jgi:hypothetical protein
MGKNAPNENDAAEELLELGLPPYFHEYRFHLGHVPQSIMSRKLNGNFMCQFRF